MGVLDFVGNIISFAMQLNVEILLILILVLAVIAFKVFSFVMKAVLTGIAFAAFPFIANYFGIPVPLTLSSIATYALLGIILYFGYGMLSFGFKATRFAMSPFKKAFKKEKTKKIVVEKESEK